MTNGAINKAKWSDTTRNCVNIVLGAASALLAIIVRAQSSGGTPFVAVVKPAELRYAYHGSEFWRMYKPRLRYLSSASAKVATIAQIQPQPVNSKESIN